MTAEAASIFELHEAALSRGGLANRGAAWKLHWLLTLGVFMEFVGHGSCGLNTKAGWLPFFRVFDISDGVAWQMMPLVGSLDIALGVIAVARPCRALYLYLAAWGCFTALLRPAAGQGWWEFFERSYNYGVPFALLFLHGFGQGQNWFGAIKTVPALPEDRTQSLLRMTRVIVGLMLIGHGGFGPFMAKSNLLGLYESAGFGSLGVSLPMLRAGIGFFEIGLGVAAFFSTRPGFFAFVCAWKLAAESLYVIEWKPLGCWEFVERGGSYVAPVAAILTLACLNASSNMTKSPGAGPLPETDRI